MHGKPRSKRTMGRVDLLGVHQTGPAEGQCSCFVEQGGIDFGKSFHGRPILDHDTVAEEAPCGNDLNNRDGKAKGARACDDQDCNRDQHGMLPVATKDPPAEEGDKCQKMDSRRVKLCSTIGNTAIAGPASFRRFHECYHFRQKRILGRSLGKENKRAGQVECAPLDDVPRFHPGRCAFAIDDREIYVASAAFHGRVHRNPLASSDHQPISRPYLLHRPVFPSSCIGQNHGTTGREPREPADGRPRAVAHDVVQRAADQQEEEQRDGRIKPSVLSVVHRFPDGNRIGQRDRERDRDVHIGAAMADGVPSRLVEESAGIHECRRRNHG